MNILRRVDLFANNRNAPDLTTDCCSQGGIKGQLSVFSRFRHRAENNLISSDKPEKRTETRHAVFT